MENKHTPCRLLPMDELQARPCEVDGRPALFHRFIDVDRVLLKVGFVHGSHAREMRHLLDVEGIALPGCETEVLRETRALVEWSDGSLSNVSLDALVFTDRREG